MKLTNVHLIPGHLAFLKNYRPNQTYLSLRTGYVQVLQTNDSNILSVQDVDSIKSAFELLKMNTSQQICILITSSSMQLILYDDMNEVLAALLPKKYSTIRLRRSQLNFYYESQSKNTGAYRFPSLIFREEKDSELKKYRVQQFAIFGNVLVFPSNEYDIFHFLKRLEIEHFQKRFVKVIHHD